MHADAGGVSVAHGVAKLTGRCGGQACQGGLRVFRFEEKQEQVLLSIKNCQSSNHIAMLHNSDARKPTTTMSMVTFSRIKV